MKTETRIVGLGHKLPRRIVKNDDPVFQVEQGHPLAPLFAGYRERRWLGAEEDFLELGAEAARAAIDQAAIGVNDISVLTGGLSVSRHCAPHDLFFLHQRLKLGAACAVLPIADEFTTFIAGLQLARDHGSRCRSHSLIVCGSNWSRHVCASEPVAWSIGDAAGAAVVQSHATRPGWCIGETAWSVCSELAGIMRMTQSAERVLGPAICFVMELEANELFRSWGRTAPCQLVEGLLKRHGIPSAEVTLIAHQATRYLLDHWRERLKPGEMLDTLSDFGNMTLASTLVTLSVKQADISTRYVVLLGLGLGIHAGAVLLERRH